MAGTFITNEAMPVGGVGVVSIPVKKSPHQCDRNAHGKLVLRNVLYCPSAVCNIIGYPEEMRREYIVTMDLRDTRSKGAITDLNGKSLAYFDPKMSLLEIRLSGPPIGPAVGPSVHGTRCPLSMRTGLRRKEHAG
jgi:hypothetical protein